MSPSGTPQPSGHINDDDLGDEVLNDPVLTAGQIAALAPEDRLNWPVEDVLVEQASLPRGASSVLREHYEQAIRVFEDTEVEVEELKQRVETLEGEKRQANEDLGDARAEVVRLQETVQYQRTVIEQQERDIEKYAQAQAQTRTYYDATDEPIPESTNTPQKELEELRLRSAIADETGEDDTESSASDTDEPEIEQPELELDEGTLRQRYQELELSVRGFQELAKKVMQRAEGMREDAPEQQIKEDFKDLHDIVKEGLQGL